MSAIAGVINLDHQPVNIEMVNRMMHAFHQFPSDDIQVLVKEHIFLGCHAQWITPESIGEKIPYYDQIRGYLLTADAIIDNRLELFEMLQIDASLRSILPDSQLIIRAYEKWGEECPNYLIGEYAFVLWDKREEKLFGARDFSGARTLYFHKSMERFAFGTTIESVLSLKDIKREINDDWMAQFIAIPSMIEAVEATSTPYKDIQQIPPSHSITIKKGNIQLTQYTTVAPSEMLHFRTDDEYIEAFHGVFKRAVKDRVRTHGKVGAQLSGGLDSGTVVSFAAKELKKQNKKLTTYSYYPSDDFRDWTPNYYLPDERDYIKETVKHVGNISDQYHNFNGRNSLEEIDSFIELMEMPYKFFENSFWLKGINEKASREGIKVLLNGARGNHSISFGSWGLTMDYYTQLLKSMKFIQLNKELNMYCMNHATGKSVMVPLIAKRTFPVFSTSHNQLKKYKFLSFINDEYAKNTRVIEKLEASGIDVTGRKVQSETQFREDHFKQPYTWNKTGAISTKLSLRYSLWDRDPTNDLRVIRFCLALPMKQYVQDGFDRSFIRRATKNYLPDKVRLNRSTRGLQAADVIHRLTPVWNSFISEVKEISKDPAINRYISKDTLSSAIKFVGDKPAPELIFDDHFKVLTRSLIVSRFIKNLNLKGGEQYETMEKTTIRSIRC